MMLVWLEEQPDSDKKMQLSHGLKLVKVGANVCFHLRP